MKPFTALPRSTILRETQLPLEVMPQSASPAKRCATPATTPSSRRHKSSKENAPPPDPNSASPLVKQSPVQPLSSAKIRSPLPPRPPPPSTGSSHLKKKLNLKTVMENTVSGASDSGVQVIVRVRPLMKGEEEEGEQIIQKMSDDSLSINGQTFTFDSVADTKSTQADIFQLVGAPLVENCLAGFNSSVFAYGQTGSGKTYTIWGPANALLEGKFSSDLKGLTPRVFELLFARIKKEQTKHADKQLTYQCRCSFLEIYNEQITDLLNPSQRNLQIREDVKSGVYVENLSEICVSSLSDVTATLIKGLLNRRTGATSLNAESSRSHSVFTCVVESHCKKAADGLSSFKTSRINLVDLAGSERQKLTRAAGERLKEAGSINRSLSQLGNLINILAEVSQSGKQRHIPYRDSRLTFLLQESLGGNAKLAMVCAISPAQSCRSESISTLRFAQRAKAIKNKAVVNEVMQDDVKVLRELIQQLKDELVRMKTNTGNSGNSNTGHATGWDARRSLNLIKYSLSRPVTLCHVDDDGDEVMEIDEAFCEKKSGGKSDISVVPIIVYNELHVDGNSHSGFPNGEILKETIAEDADVDMEEESELFKDHERLITECEEVIKKVLGKAETNCAITGSKSANQITLSNMKEMNKVVTNGESEDLKSSITDNGEDAIEVSDVINQLARSDEHEFVHDSSPINVSIIPHSALSVIEASALSDSPRIHIIRKSIRTSSTSIASPIDNKDHSELLPEAVSVSFKRSPKHVSSRVTASNSARTSSFAPTSQLAASIQRGLEVIGNQRKSTCLRQSSYRFSMNPPAYKSAICVDKVKFSVGTQTLPQDQEMLETQSLVSLCTNCQSRINQVKLREATEKSNLQIVPYDASDPFVKAMKHVPKAVEKVLAGAIRREMALEEYCAKQNAEITQLNRLVQQYRHERECNAIIGQMREDKILRLETLMDGVLPTEEFMEEELICLSNEHKLLQDKYDNHPELLRTKLELQRVENELDEYRNFFDIGEKEVLLEEIQDLRTQLHDYMDSPSLLSKETRVIQRLGFLCEPTRTSTLAATPEPDRDTQGKHEQERAQWAEAEGEWISLAEQLKFELEETRSFLEMQKQELDSEKKCAEELKDAMQMAMQGHARMLEQYADLEEKHIVLLARHRKIQEGIDDVRKAAVKAGVKGAESEFINVLASQIAVLKVEKERERQHLRDENRGLQAQLRDTSEAVQAAGELLVRLKDAEEAAVAFENRAIEAEKEAITAHKQLDELRKKQNYDQSVAEPSVLLDGATYDTEYDQKWREELKPCYDADDDMSKLAEPSSWFTGYDRCNV